MISTWFGAVKPRWSTLLLLAAIAVELYYLLNGLGESPPQLVNSGRAVAELVRKTREVRAQDDGSLVWDETRSGETLYQKQRILTGAASKAEIAFLDGTGISIDENSLISLERLSNDTRGGSRIVLTLLRGHISKAAPKKRHSEIAKPPAFEVRIGAEVLRPSSEAQFEAKVDREGPARIEMRAGEAQLDSQTGQRELKAGESWDGKQAVSAPFTLQAPVAEPRAPELVFPANTSRINPGASVNLVWKPVEGAQSYEIRIGSKITSAKEPQFEFSANQAGDYEWKVRSFGEDGTPSPWSETRLLRVQSPDIPLPPPPKLLAPEFKKKPKKNRSWLEWLIPSAYAEEADTYEIELKWDPVPGARTYRIQISRQSNFHSFLANSETTEAHWTWDYSPGMENSKGRVFYRVASVAADGKVGEFSDPEPLPIPEEIRNPAPPPVAKAPRPAKPRPAPVIARSRAVTHVYVPEGRWQFSVALATGFGSRSQKSAAADLTSVEMESPYLQQKIDMSVAQEYDWALDADFSPSQYKSSNTAQAPMKGYEGGVSLYGDWSQRTAPWKLLIGGRAGVDFRWEKAGPQTLTSKNGLSLGPAAKAMRNYGQRPWDQVGIDFSLPILGVALHGFYGVEGSVWGEWQPGLIRGDWLGIKAALEGNCLFWREPESTRSLSWAIWLAPVFHLGS